MLCRLIDAEHVKRQNNSGPFWAFFCSQEKPQRDGANRNVCRMSYTFHSHAFGVSTWATKQTAAVDACG